jgi:hypothetical protein
MASQALISFSWWQEQSRHFSRIARRGLCGLCPASHATLAVGGQIAASLVHVMSASLVLERPVLAQL